VAIFEIEASVTLVILHLYLQCQVCLPNIFKSYPRVSFLHMKYALNLYAGEICCQSAFSTCFHHLQS